MEDIREEVTDRRLSCGLSAVPAQSWNYHTFRSAPKTHQKIAQWAIAGIATPHIASALRVSVDFVDSVLLHPPISEWVNEMMVVGTETKIEIRKAQDRCVKKAVSVYEDLMESENEDVRLKAANSAMDRHYSGQYSKQTRTVIPEEQRNVTAELLKQRDKMLAIEATRKLVNELGDLECEVEQGVSHETH